MRKKNILFFTPLKPSQHFSIFFFFKISIELCKWSTRISMCRIIRPWLFMKYWYAPLDKYQWTENLPMLQANTLLHPQMVHLLAITWIFSRGWRPHMKSDPWSPINYIVLKTSVHFSAQMGIHVTPPSLYWYLVNLYTQNKKNNNNSNSNCSDTHTWNQINNKYT